MQTNSKVTKSESKNAVENKNLLESVIPGNIKRSALAAFVS
jgi:hypothetical protein